MSTRLVRIVGALLLGVAVAGAPALSYAQGSGHFGGGGHSSGGGHSGGGHFGGGHFGGGNSGGGHFGGGHVSTPHFAGGHVSAPHFSAGHAGGFNGGVAAAHFSAPHVAAGAPGFHGAAHGAFPTVGSLHAAGRFPQPGPGWHGGTAWGGWHGWGGGYWHGGFWPHVYFRPGFAWFLPVLPLGYATFWWAGMPYYYWNNLYYTWSPGDNGYVVTDPPPSAGSEYDSSVGSDSGTTSAPTGAGDVYLYPRNGQSDAQTQNDRYECHSWAANQTGFDPTRSQQTGSGSAVDYRRAMIACLDARGYSAR